METIDIAPRFSVAGAKLVEEKQDNLHQALISVAEMMREMVRIWAAFPGFRESLESDLNTCLSEEDPKTPCGHPGTGFLTECEEAVESWRDAGDEFLSALSDAVHPSSRDEPAVAEVDPEDEDIFAEQRENNDFAHDDDPFVYTDRALDDN